MTERLRALINLVRDLSPEERAAFLDLVANELAVDLAAAWSAELERRQPPSRPAGLAS
jgi:hypothetical protein